MTVGSRVFGMVVCCVLLMATCGFAPSISQSIGSDVIVTAAPVYEPLAALRGGERFPKGAQLLMIHDGNAEPLVADFASSADASVSFDGGSVLFAAKKAAGDPWQIWELTLADHKVRQVVSSSSDAIRPLYLPGWRVVYALRTPQGFQLQSTRLMESKALEEIEGTGARASFPLTYMGANAVPADVLADGRILFEAGFPLGQGATPEMFLVYSDGSGVESYRCDHPASVAGARWGGKQLGSGDVVFTHGTSLARFTSPVAHEERVTAPREEYAGTIAETKTGEWLVSARESANAKFVLKLWKPGATATQTLLAKTGMDVVEPVLVAAQERPRRHPSALHDWDYANLLALDARVSRDGALKGVPASVRLETQDADGRAVAMGAAPVEADGSFFLKAPADRAIRFVLLDAKGAVLRQEHGWFWIRRGEQRICVGCHAGPERAAENRVPEVLLHTTTPVDLTGSAQTVQRGGN
jgi:Hydrazine synthase alpha subunit middle domain